MKKELHKYITDSFQYIDLENIGNKRFTNVLADLGAINEYPWVESVMTALIRENYPQIILACHKHCTKLSKEDIKKVAYYISKANALWLDIVEYVISSIAYSLNILDAPFYLSSYSKSHFTESNFCGHWIFTYDIEKRKSTDLVILNDGTALTENGSVKYDWNIIEDKYLNLHIGELVYYQGQFHGDNTIKGSAFSKTRHWEWKAEREYTGIDERSLLKGQWLLQNDDPDLPDNRLTFLPNGALDSSVYGRGTWKLLDKKIIIETAKGFIQYQAKYKHKEILGIAVNNIGNRWSFKLSRIPINNN